MTLRKIIEILCDDCGTTVRWTAQTPRIDSLPPLALAEKAARRIGWTGPDKNRKHRCQVCSIVKAEHPEVGRGRG